MNMRWWIGAAAALATVAAGAGAMAQISAHGGPIDVSSDHFQANDAEREATYSGKVEVLQGQNRMRSDLMNVYFRKSGAPAAQPVNASPQSSWGQIDRLEAIGNVYFVTPTQIVRGDRAEYTQASDTLVVTGNVVVTQGENVMHGERLVVQVGAKRSTMESNTGRVRSVFYPDQKQQGGAH